MPDEKHVALMSRGLIEAIRTDTLVGCAIDDLTHTELLQICDTALYYMDALESMRRGLRNLASTDTL